MKAVIRARALELGFDACRFTSAAPPEGAHHFQRWLAAGRHGEMAYLARNADRRVDPRRVLERAQTTITLAASYAGPNPGQAWSPPTSTRGAVARYARYLDYHHVLAPPLRTLAGFVNQTGGPTTESLWYVDTGPLLERDLAQRAGLGFIGKHTNLINRKLGNWFFLAEILTSLELAPDEPEPNRCGTCQRCLPACPTGAIVAPFQLEARRCISYLTIELRGPIPLDIRPAIGHRVFGCDDCLEVCPWNRFAKEGRLMRQHVAAELAALDLAACLHLDEAAFRRRFAGTPILRAQRRGFLRNVCVALGNVADPQALPALQTAAADADPLVAEHAQWAIEQIIRRDARGQAPTSVPSRV